MNVLVVGAGEMGRWFADVLDSELDAEIAFADANPEVAEAATEAVGGRTVALSTDERFDALCVAVPMSAVEDAIETHAEKAERALVDVTGQMADPVGAMREAAPERERVSLHPLFSASNAPGNVAVVADESGPITDRIRDGLESAGNDLVTTTVAEHDDAMATVQAGTHAAVLAFAATAEDVPEGMTTPIFEDLTALAEQVTGNTPAVYAEVQDVFDGGDAVADAANRLADADREEFEALYREAGQNVGRRESDGGVDDA